MTVEVKISGAERLEELIRKYRAIAPKAVAKGMTRAALHQEGVVKQVIQRKFPGSRTGQLARSFKAEIIKKDGKLISAGVFSDLVYAGIQDEGGTIRPRNAKMLAIPLKKIAVGKWPRHYPKGALTLINSKRGNVLLVDSVKLKNGKIDPIFVLKDQVTIRGKDYLRIATRVARDRIGEILEETLLEAIDESGGGDA